MADTDDGAGGGVPAPRGGQGASGQGSGGQGSGGQSLDTRISSAMSKNEAASQVRDSLVKKLQEMIDKDPERVAKAIRAWVHSGGGA